MSLGRAIAGGAVWTLASRNVVRLIGFVSTLILARLLVPEDFGLIAQVMLVVEILDTATEFGVQIPLIQNQNATRAHYNSGWSLKIIRGVATSIILLVIAAPLSAAFNEPRLENIVYVASVVPLIQGFQNIGVVDFRKHFQFHKEFQLNLTVRLVGFVTVVLLAFAWRSYWAFVVANIAASIARVGVSFVLSPFRPKWDLSEWRYLFNVSKWVWIHEIASELARKLDIISLSVISSTGAVGSYQVSRELGSTPTTELSMPVARALFPGLAKISGEIDRFRQMFIDVIAVSQVLALPAAIGVFVLAEPMTLVLLGEGWRAELGDSWTEAVMFVKLLSLWAFFATYGSFSIVAFNAIGRTDITALLSGISLLIRVVVLYITISSWGAVGVAAGMFLSQIVHTLVIAVAVQRYSLFALNRFFSRSWRTFVATAFMWFSLVEGVDYLMAASPAPVIGLVVCVIAGAAVFAVMHLILWLLSGRPEGPESLFIELAGSMTGKGSRQAE